MVFPLSRNNSKKVCGKQKTVSMTIKTQEDDNISGLHEMYWQESKQATSNMHEEPRRKQRMIHNGIQLKSMRGSSLHTSEKIN